MVVALISFSLEILEHVSIIITCQFVVVMVGERFPVHFLPDSTGNWDRSD